jgi:hypothetical protein
MMDDTGRRTALFGFGSLVLGAAAFAGVRHVRARLRRCDRRQTCPFSLRADTIHLHPATIASSASAARLR